MTTALSDTPRIGAPHESGHPANRQGDTPGRAMHPAGRCTRLFSHPALQPHGSTATRPSGTHALGMDSLAPLELGARPFSLFYLRMPRALHLSLAVSLSILGHIGKRRERRSSLSTTVSLPTISANANLSASAKFLRYGCASGDEKTHPVLACWFIKMHLACRVGFLWRKYAA